MYSGPTDTSRRADSETQPWRKRTMELTASIRFDNFSVGAVKAGYLLWDYLDGKI